MVLFNYPSNITGLGDFIIYASQESNYALPMGILSLIFMLTFMVGLTAGSRKAVMSAGFVTFIFSVWFVRLGIISPIFSIGLILLTILGAIFSSGENQI